ncbi:predicted protein [Plenodomus lingam JN3]|uniref:Predicted protein n=1 Tax=Leptosphaeria maculans (strain JN3 / isolate v23.1.3 / race Av1-4-5-6-7-8) TaxID=985895 RepID=E5AD68_LEPMJ|nr:predicted protein [Plenodomus lingam JN3]CBY02420.1 predicted protein [Plenodomus lingam JN3]
MWNKYLLGWSRCSWLHDTQKSVSGPNVIVILEWMGCSFNSQSRRWEKISACPIKNKNQNEVNLSNCASGGCSEKGYVNNHSLREDNSDEQPEWRILRHGKSLELWAMET